MTDTVDERALLRVLKLAAGALKAAGVPFALSGGFAAYARGAPPSDHDVDFVIRPEDADTAVRELVGAGFSPGENVEDWLVKVYEDDCQVDLIHTPSEVPVTSAMLERAAPLKVESVTVPVLDATDLLTMLLRSFTEHECDFARPLLTARALREQVDWRRVRDETDRSPYAHAFLVLLSRLGLIDDVEVRDA